MNKRPRVVIHNHYITHDSNEEFQKRERVRLKTPRPLPSGRTVNLVGMIDYLRPDGLYDVRIVTPGIYGGGILKVPASEIEKV